MYKHRRTHTMFPCFILSNIGSWCFVHSQVTVLFAGQQIPKSPFEVNVDKALGDATKVTAKGPGLEPLGNIANKPTFFDIYTAGLAVQA